MWSLLVVGQLGCGSNSETANAGGSGHGGGGSGGAGEAAGAGGGGGSNAAMSTPLFERADCGSLAAASDLKPATGATAATVFAVGQLVGGRVDPDSTTNQEHHWSIQLAPGFYHLVLDARTADGASTNIGIKVTRRLPSGDDEQLVFGNESARYYRDEAFFEVTTSAPVPLTVVSNFDMEDYLMGVFANGTPVPSPLFDKCPAIQPLMVGKAVSFTLGSEGTADEEQWFVVDLPLGNYMFMLDAAQADGADTNLIYYVDVLDRFGQESRAKQTLFVNKSGPHFTSQGTLAVGETGSYWVRLLNGHKDLNITMTVSSAQ
jgi:hypothetical protein